MLNDIDRISCELEDKMESLVKRIKWMGLGLIVMLFIMMFFGLFIPQNRQIRQSNKENFVLSVDAYETSINQYINNLRQLSSVMTTDSHIGHSIDEYHSNLITEEELRQELSPRFNDSFIESGAIYIKRIIEDNDFESIGTVTFDVEYLKTFNEQSWLVSNNDSTYLIIYQPIIYNANYLGHDLYYIDITTYSKSNPKGINYRLFSSLNEIIPILGNYDYQKMEGRLIYETNNEIHVIGQLEGIYGFYMISVDESLLEPDLEKIYYNMAIVVTFIFITFFIFNGLTIYKVRKAVQKTVQKSNEYRIIADYDSLTMALSRSYFERWRKEYYIKPKDEGWFASIVMIDVDNLKQINDEYGHVLGDDVLREVGQRIQSSLRSNDMFFRYGGDEFILILEDCNIDIADKIINRIIDEMKSIDHYMFNVEISYGIELISDGDLLNDVIHKADVKMYKYKRRKKS